MGRPKKRRKALTKRRSRGRQPETLPDFNEVVELFAAVGIMVAEAIAGAPALSSFSEARRKVRTRPPAPESRQLEEEAGKTITLDKQDYRFIN